MQLVEALDELKKFIDLSDPPLKKIEVVRGGEGGGGGGGGGFGGGVGGGVGGT